MSEVIEGVVSQLNQTTTVSGGSDNSGVSTTVTLTGLIDGRPFRIDVSEVPIVANGDRLSLAGESRKGVFCARAYHNHTNGSQGHAPYAMFVIIGGLFAFGAVIGILYFAPAFVEMPAALLFPLIFMAGGSYFVALGMKVRTAAEALWARVGEMA